MRHVWDIAAFVCAFLVVALGIASVLYSRRVANLLKRTTGEVTRINRWYDRWDVGWGHCRLFLEEVTSLMRLDGKEYNARRDEVFPMALVGLPRLFVRNTKYRAAILQQDASGDLRIRWAYNFEPSHKASLSFGKDTVPGQVLVAGKSRYVPNVRDDGTCAKHYDKFLDYLTLYSVPLGGEDLPGTVLNIHGGDADSLLLEDRIWVDLVGRLIVLCLELDSMKAS